MLTFFWYLSDGRVRSVCVLGILLRWKSEAIFRTIQISTTYQDYNMLGDGRQGWKCSGAEISHAEMSLVPKIPRAKKSPCRNVHLRSALQTFPGRCQNVPGMKNPCKNVSCQNLRFRNGGKPLSVLRSSVHRFKNLLMGRLLVFDRDFTLWS